jgi:hypothetical protein
MAHYMDTSPYIFIYCQVSLPAVWAFSLFCKQHHGKNATPSHKASQNTFKFGHSFSCCNSLFLLRMMVRFSLLMIVIAYLVYSSSMPLSLNNRQFQQTVLVPSQNAGKPCGQAVISCIALPGNPIAKPIRCGRLTNTPVCRSGSDDECQSFCEQER